MQTFPATNCNNCSLRYVCNCLRVTEEQVVCALKTNPVQTIKELRLLTGAGDGCTCCHRKLAALIEQHVPQPDPFVVRHALPAAAAG